MTEISKCCCQNLVMVYQILTAKVNWFTKVYAHLTFKIYEVKMMLTY